MPLKIYPIRKHIFFLKIDRIKEEKKNGLKVSGFNYATHTHIKIIEK